MSWTVKLPTEINLGKAARALLFVVGTTVLMGQSAPWFGGGPPGTSGSSVTCSDGSLTCGSGNIAINTANSNNFSAAQTFSGGFTTSGDTNNGSYNQNFNATAVCATGAGIAEFCIDGTSTIGEIIGPTGGYTSGSTGSQQLCLMRTVSGATSCGTITYGTGGTMSFGASSGYNFGTTTLLHGQDIMGATCALSASGTMPAGTSGCKLTFTGITTMTVTYSSAYGTQGICVTNDETTTNGSKAVCSAASAVVTATSGDVVDFILTGK